MATEKMESLAAHYADQAVRSVFIYTREAHPAENYGHHTSMDDKRALARVFKEHSNVQRQILIDSLDGAAHRAYGEWPNMTYIVGRGGIIHYKASWISVDDIEDSLTAILDFEAIRTEEKLIPYYCERSAWCTRDNSGFMDGLRRNGPKALDDLAKGRQKQGLPSAPPPGVPLAAPGNFYKPK